MPARLCILGCHNFAREVAAACVAEDWTDVLPADFPAHCGHPPVSWDELRALLPEDCTQVVVMGHACLGKLADPPAGFPPLRLLPQKQCFHLVAAAELVDEAIVNGGYLITPGWLADWRGRVVDMGFTLPQAGDFFKDFARELVLFDTGVDADAGKHLADLAQTVKLPARRVAVGLDHTRMLLARVVLEWRFDEAQRSLLEQARRHARELADHVAAVDLLARLARSQDETGAIAAIEELFRMLFAPAVWHYLRVERGQPISDSDIPADLMTALTELQSPYAWTPSGRGFLLRITRDAQVLGLVAADALAFPEYRERYLNQALSMLGVCALAIENARTRKRLVEAEKMASLGFMVAGVAHEINTPLGVGLAAASTLQEQSHRLAHRFAERAMTQSDLQRYLDTAQAEAGLIRVNLERIGGLVDAFRQVAVEGKQPAKSRFRIKACIEEIMASLGGKLDPERFAVVVSCEDALEIESYPADWNSIFGNLVGNSIRHGFKGRERGRIEITILRRDGLLVVDYADDGAGLGREVQAHIFDPFFSTDLQQGMGLGMHLVYNLITHRLNGGIVCDSLPGRGAHFHIEIPL